MNKLEYEICVGLGDNLVIRIYFDSIKHNYDEIRISHSKHIVNHYRGGDPKYFKFLDDIGNLLFSEPPYVFDHEPHPEIQRIDTILNIANQPRKPDLDKQLCIGKSLNLGHEYIVMTTKIRCLSRQTYRSISPALWATLKKLSAKYKIVVLGERKVEESKEYIHQKDTIFGIYNDIVANISSEHLVDLTIPALGIVAPELSQIQQDCLIMKEAKFTLALGIGGNFWLAAVSGDTVCFRADDDLTIDLLSNDHFPTLFATKNWEAFLHKLEEFTK